MNIFPISPARIPLDHIVDDPTPWIVSTGPKPKRTITNFSKHQRRQFFATILIDAVIANTVTNDTNTQRVMNRITRRCELIRHEITGQDKALLSPKDTRRSNRIMKGMCKIAREDMKGNDVWIFAQAVHDVASGIHETLTWPAERNHWRLLKQGIGTLYVHTEDVLPEKERSAAFLRWRSDKAAWLAGKFREVLE